VNAFNPPVRALLSPKPYRRMVTTGADAPAAPAAPASQSLMPLIGGGALAALGFAGFATRQDPAWCFGAVMGGALFALYGNQLLGPKTP